MADDARTKYRVDETHFEGENINATGNVERNGNPLNEVTFRCYI